MTLEGINAKGKWRYPLKVGARVKRLLDGRRGTVMSQSQNDASIRSVVRFDGCDNEECDQVFHFGLAAYGPPQIEEVETP